MKPRLTALVAGAVVAALALSACGSSSGSKSSSSGSSGPLKIGILVNKSGVLASLGSLAQDAYDVAAAQAPTYLNGRKVEFVKVEGDGTAAGTVAAVTQLIEQDHVKLLTGPNTDDQGLALAPIVKRLGAVWLDSTSQGNALSGSSCSAGYYKIDLNVNQYAKLISSYLTGTTVTKWSFIGSDFGFGHDLATAVGTQIKGLGGSVNQTIFSPLGTADFGTAISQLSGSDSTGLVVSLAGSDAATFAKQAVQFKLFSKYKTIIGDGLLSNIPAAQLPALAPSLTNSVEIAVPFSNQSTDAAATAYLSQWKTQFAGTDKSFEEQNFVNFYNTVVLYEQAVAKAKSDDATAVRKALSGGTFDLAQGPIMIRAADNLAQLPGTVLAPKQVSGSWQLTLVKQFAADQLTVPVDGCKL